MPEMARRLRRNPFSNSERKLLWKEEKLHFEALYLEGAELHVGQDFSGLVQNDA